MKGPSGSLIARLISETQGSLPVLLCQSPLKTPIEKKKLLISKHFQNHIYFLPLYFRVKWDNVVFMRFNAVAKCLAGGLRFESW